MSLLYTSPHCYCFRPENTHFNNQCELIWLVLEKMLKLSFSHWSHVVPVNQVQPKISQRWQNSPPQPRIRAISESLARRGETQKAEQSERQQILIDLMVAVIQLQAENKSKIAELSPPTINWGDHTWAEIKKGNPKGRIRRKGANWWCNQTSGFPKYLRFYITFKHDWGSWHQFVDLPNHKGSNVLCWHDWSIRNRRNGHIFFFQNMKWAHVQHINTHETWP